jgi:hypothetical protein
MTRLSAGTTAAEVELALLADTTGLDDDTDWEALYAEDTP